MADTSVETEISSSTDERGLWGPYWSDKDTGVIVFIDNLSDLSFARTIDAGATWATTEIEAGDARHATAWYDKETPGDSGTLVHIAWLDATAGAAYYITVDVDDGLEGTKRTIQSSLTVSTTPKDLRIALTKTVNGNLLCAFSTQSEIECLRSTDSGVNWTDRDNPYESGAEEDWLLLFPADVDAGDAAGIFWDRTADELSLKMYDDSANTWTETSIATSMVEDAIHLTMDAAVRHSDGHILLAAHSNDDNATDDLMTWDLTVNSIASPTVNNAKTNIFTNQDVSGFAAVVINQQNDDVYVAYLKGTTWEAEGHVVYHKSDDDMATWGTEQAYSETLDDNRIIQGGRTIGNDGGRVQFVFYNDDNTEIYVNLVNDIEIVASAASSTPLPLLNAYYG